MNKLFLVIGLVISSPGFAQVAADKWVDSVFQSLDKDQKIAQLMVVRMSSVSGSGATRRVTFYEKEVEDAVKKYNVGGICLFQGGPMKQAALINQYQRIAKTPILIAIDGENGLGMRFDSVAGLPRQMMLGAVQDPELIYQYGKLVGEQCKRIGIHVNYAPVVDINNNPANPVINDRSFGEDKYRVSEWALQYMKGMQDVGVMACAKHFPGHGDVSVDSHYDLPVITKSRAELDSLELYPFRQLFSAGVGSVMVAHLSIPAIDTTSNRATSISYNNVTKLLRSELKYEGLTFTDALEMKGVTKYFPDGDASVQSLIAGNDMLCLPGDVPMAIDKIREAIRKDQLSWDKIDYHVKRVLKAKYLYGLNNIQPVNLHHLTEDLNAGIDKMRKLVAENAITLLRNDDSASFPLRTGKKVAYLGIGLNADNEFALQLRKDYNANAFYFDYKMDSVQADAMLSLLQNRYDVVVIGLHNLNRFPANNFGVSRAAAYLVNKVQTTNKTVTMLFGNPYAVKQVCDAPVLVVCYEDDAATHQKAADLLYGRYFAKGKLPVTVCDPFNYGYGITENRMLRKVQPAEVGLNKEKLMEIDSIVEDAIRQQAIPGAVILVAKDGKIAYEKAFGYLGYDSTEQVYPQTLYDLASVTKVMATTVSLMKLYDEGKLKLNKKLGDYLPWVKGSNKQDLTVKDIMLHQAGLKSFIPFYRETIDLNPEGLPKYSVYVPKLDSLHLMRVAANMYMRDDWMDTIYRRILQSEVVGKGKYVYSDNDFIFLGKIVEAISGMTLDQYVKKEFYDKLNMSTTGFKPLNRFSINRIAPTEDDLLFRKQLIQGDVHDPGAAMFGGVAGHAGLFSDAYDLAVLSQVMLNNGAYNGHQFFKKETIKLFTAYQSAISRRGYGFDKPEKDNATRKEPYPTLSASPDTYGHTGFTGTCFWIDPKYNLTYIFLSNRVNSPDPNKFGKINVRPKVHEVIYHAMIKK
ncbi:glycoside hydrolase family 3 N-terminal domain-containing protein [Flavitalea sp.]|nr:glycoside hydrolase family 3 N-terminal domain-containing protein [Flavitalea sp.]